VPSSRDAGVTTPRQSPEPRKEGEESAAEAIDEFVEHSHIRESFAVLDFLGDFAETRSARG
jgi:hypothetical protein